MNCSREVQRTAVAEVQPTAVTESEPAAVGGVRCRTGRVYIRASQKLRAEHTHN